MRIKNITVNRKDFRLGRMALRWAATGMNLTRDSSLEIFKGKARQMLSNPIEICRIGRKLRPYWAENGYLTQSAVLVAIKG